MEPMKIERVEVFGVEVPLVGQYKSAYRTNQTQKSAVVRITASDGTIGVGNVDPFPGYSKETIEDTLRCLGRILAPHVMDMDPRNIHQVLQRMDAAVASYLDAKAAVEMACVDLTARASNVPVHSYLGGAVKDTLLFNAWIGIVTPDEAASEATAWQQRGFRSAKVKVGGVGGDIQADRDRVKAVREAVGPHFNLRIDANASYDVESAVKLARMVSVFDLQLFEQPVAADDVEGMAAVRQRAAGIPIMADESVLDHASLIRIIRASAADLVKVKVMKQGGIHETHRMIATAAAAGIRCVVGHGFGLTINTMAEIMVAAASRNVIDGLECVGPLKMADDIVDNKLDLSLGSLQLPVGPGLGLTIDEAKLERFRVR
jgi:L-Ala-D/L-Glu epimerase